MDIQNWFFMTILSTLYIVQLYILQEGGPFLILESNSSHGRVLNIPHTHQFWTETYLNGVWWSFLEAVDLLWK